MNIIDAIHQRRSVKAFDPDHQISEEDTRALLSAALVSPTAFNLQHWRFVLVEDPDVRARLREAAWGQKQVTDASLLIVLCADLRSWEKDPTHYWRDAPDHVRDRMADAITNYYRDNPRLERDEAMRSCGIAAQTLMLAAKGLGYDSCPMDGFDFGQVADIIQLPEDHVVSMFVAVGKALQPAPPRSGPLDPDTAIVRDTF